VPGGDSFGVRGGRFGVKRTRVALLIAGSVLAAVLAVVFFVTLRGFLRTALLEPLLRGWFVVRWFFRQISQAALWYALVLLGGALLLRTFLRTAPHAVLPPPSKGHREEPRGEVDRLATMIRKARSRPLYRAMLARDLEGMASRIVACKEGISIDEARATLFAEEDDRAPLALRRLFRSLRPRRGLGRDGRFERDLEEALSLLEGHLKEG